MHRATAAKLLPYTSFGPGVSGILGDVVGDLDRIAEGYDGGGGVQQVDSWTTGYNVNLRPNPGGEEMSNDGPVPHRRMPMRYLAVWMLITGSLAAYQTHAFDAWPTLAVGAELIFAAVVGGMFWGWVFWRWFGLHKMFPP